MPEIGVEGQARLARGRVLVVGVGGLGSPAALYLAAAGVGTIGLVDADRLELGNLQRQIAHATASIGLPKVESARETLARLNPDVQVVLHPVRFEAENAADLIDGYDLVIDATDNFAAKFLLADACHAARKPYSHGGVLRFLGQTMTVLPGRSACYRCVFDAPPDGPQPAPVGPLGIVPGVIGVVQAGEAIKYLMGRGQLLLNRLLVYDGLRADVRIVPVKRNPACRLCGEGHAQG